MTTIKEKLMIIKERKEIKLNSMKKEGKEGDISYSILSEEIEDVAYALKAFEVLDETECGAILNSVASQTTSESIYDAILTGA